MSLRVSALALLCCIALAHALPAVGLELTEVDERFLDLIQRKAFDFFWQEADPETGLVRDQANNFDQTKEEHRLHRASIASVGFGLSAYCVGVERGWITKEQAEERIRNTLTTFDTELERDGYGLYYHWIDMRNGRRWMWDEHNGSEISSIDTALFLAGAIGAAEYWNAKYGDSEFNETVDRIYRGIRWNAFAEHLTSFYNEYILVTLLGIGCPDHTLSPEVWHNMGRNYQVSTANRKGEADFPRIFYPSLFIHLFPQAWFDFRNKHDAYANYFLNSRNAVLANRQYCIDHGPDGIADPRYRFTTYGSNSWGLSACEAPPPKGYVHYGEAEPALADEPSAGMRGIDGTVAIHAAGGSMPFAPDESLAMMKYLLATFGKDLWGRYGFCDSYNTDPSVKHAFNNEGGTLWRADIVSGLDQGIILLMIENYRSGLIWDSFMRNPRVQAALKKVGFVAQAPLPAGGEGLDLSGEWLFRTGDNEAWSAPDCDDETWDKMTVPMRWEDAGYPEYDGIAWYRRRFMLPAELEGASGDIVIRFGAIDDADEVFINGVCVGGKGDFPPGKQSAWDSIRLYRVPKGCLEFGAENTVAVRVNDNTGGGGIWKAPVDVVTADAVQYRPFYVPIGGE